MPTNAEKSTTTLISELKALQEGQVAYDLAVELENRKILSTDSDASAKHTGGIRPEHLPLNP